MKNLGIIALLLGGGAAIGVFSTLLLKSAPVDQSHKAFPRHADEERIPDVARKSGPASAARPYPKNAPLLSSPAVISSSSARPTSGSRSTQPSVRAMHTSKSPASSSSPGGADAGQTMAQQNIPVIVGGPGISPPAGGSNGGGGITQPTAASQENTNSSSSNGSGEIVLDVPSGYIAPAVFYDQEPHSPQQQAALDRIAAEFSENASTPTQGFSQDENWTTARQIADEQYLTLFGYQAYNQRHLQAAKEAVKEKTARPAPTPTAP